MARVVVTGIGAITPIGNNRKKFWQAIILGKSGIKKITRFDVSKFRCQIAAEITDFSPELYCTAEEMEITDYSTQLAIGAMVDAIEDANLNQRDYTDADIYMGIAVGGVVSGENNYYRYYNDQTCCPNLIYKFLPHYLAQSIKRKFNILGTTRVFSTGCTSSTDSVGYAFERIKSGKADIIFAGGAEAPIMPLTLAAFDNIHALTPNFNDAPESSSRPFDEKRSGFIAGEGACILVLESLESALARQAPIYAEIVGYANTLNAYHMTSPRPDGLSNIVAIKRVLEQAQLEPSDIDYINAHGSSTKLNDSTETNVIKEVFGSHAYNLKVSSTKSMTGHLLGATGAVEAAATILAIKNNIYPPTINYEHPDSECDLDYVPNKSKQGIIQNAISNACGFGGFNSALIFRKSG